MGSEVRGVVATARGEPVSTVTIVVPDPGPGEVVVRVQAYGVCTPTSTTARVASTTISRSCWGTRPPVRSRRWGPA